MKGRPRPQSPPGIYLGLGLVLVIAASLFGPGPALGVVFEPLEFDAPEQERRYQSLIAELRCLVCQNQNVADSEAALAGDLRAEVYRMINEGEDDDAIIRFMVARYGDFVLYRPPWKMTTALLWLTPLILIVIGAFTAYRAIARSREAAATQLSERERERLQQLVAGSAAHLNSKDAQRS